MTASLTFHPLADIFPLLDGTDYEALVTDIATYGLREPITLDADNQILDGRNRYRGCLKAGVPIRTEMFDGDDPLAFVLSKNLHRRHLNESQRAMVATRIATLQHGVNQHTHKCGPSQEQAAEMLNVSPRLIQYARKVERQGSPELVAAVNAGVITVKAAQHLVHLPVEKQVARIERDQRKARGESRQPDSYYRTPTDSTRLLLRVEKFGWIILEPACGDGAISRVLEDHGYVVISRDLHNRGYGDSGHDFLKATSLPAEDIVTNFPFDDAAAEAMTRHALDLDVRKIAVLHRLAWLEGENRYSALFSQRKLARVWAFSPRQTLWRGDDAHPESDGGMTAYGWFVFERDHHGPYTGDWLPGEHAE
jgi:ParB-like chromosome segregation protein Spo0J